MPITNPMFNEKALAEARLACAPDFEVVLEQIQSGTASIESRAAEYINSAGIISVIGDGLKQRAFDGVFIFCFGSPGVPYIREMFDVPIIGGFEPAVTMAMNLAGTFSIVTVEKKVVPFFRDLARNLQVTQSLVSIRYINIPVLGLNNEDELFLHLYEQSKAAIEDDGAECIVLGCTGMLDIATRIQSTLADEGYAVPVIDPTYAAMGFLQSIIRANYTQSREMYPKYLSNN